MLKRLLTGGDNRKTRFHTGENNFIGFSTLLREFPVTASQKLATALSGERPQEPWWPIQAIREVEKILTEDMHAIEFGTGGSTVWLASRVGHVVGREHDEKWAAMTMERLNRLGISNAQIEICNDEHYYQISPDQYFDFAVVDGKYRWKCLESLSYCMKAGSYIYYDNSDMDKDSHLYQELGVSGSFLAKTYIGEQLALGAYSSVQEFHGMLSAEVHAGSGMLIRVA